MDAQTPAEFLADVPATDAPSAPKQIGYIPNPNQLVAISKQTGRHAAITALAVDIGYNRDFIEKNAQTVYLIIDDTAPNPADIDPVLAQAYQALTRAAQLLFEAQTHLYRYATKLENAHQAYSNS